jgi:hypothetical protein
MFVQDLAATLHIMLPSGVQGGNSLKCTSAAARLTYKIVAAAALFGLAAPASAQMPPAPFPPMAFSPLAAGLPNSGAVANFYQRRGNPLIWFASGPRSPAATELLNLLQVARIDGLTNNSRLAMNVQLAIRLAQTGHPTALLEADRTLSTAWVSYVQALRRPPRGTIYGSDAVLPTTGVDRILSEAIGARSMPQHIRAVSTVNPLYGELRQLAVQQYRQWGVIEPRLEANLERTRALPSSGRFVLVDINSARLFMFENGRVADSMKVIVGKAEKQTPMMASMIHYATFNPYWNVPDDMVRDRIAVNVLSQGTKYLHERGYEVVLNWSEHAPVLSPDSIDWRAIADGRTTVRVRQVLLIVGGGIAAYKSCELVRLLKKAGHRVTPVLTSGGAHFVTPMSLGTLAESPVYTSLWDLKDEVEMGHIQLSRAGGPGVVCPATADLLAKMAAASPTISRPLCSWRPTSRCSSRRR